MKKLLLLAAVATTLFAGISATPAVGDPLDKSSPKIAHGIYRDRGKSSPKIAHGMNQGGDYFDDELFFILDELMYELLGR